MPAYLKKSALKSETLGSRAIDQCSHCRHLGLFGSICDAFPNGIPGEIRIGRADHSLPYPGDQGIRFAARPPDTTSGAVRFVRISVPEAPQPTLAGALWLADDGTTGNDQAMGFLPVRSAKEAGLFWYRQLRDAWRQDRAPAALFDDWITRDWGGWLLGSVDRANGGLVELARRLGADPPRLPRRR